MISLVREEDTKKEAIHDSKHMNHVQGHSNHEENHSESHAHHDHSKHHSHEEHHHSEYENHNGHDHSHHHEHMVKDFKKRFYISLMVTIPILILSPMIQSFFGGVNWQPLYNSYILFILATFIFFYGGWPFITGGAISELKDRNPGMMTLIA